MTEIRETYAYLWVTGFEDPDDVTTTLGLEPSEVRTNRKGVTSWYHYSPSSRNESPIDLHLAELAQILTACKDRLAEVQDRYQVGINCVGVFTNSSPGFHIDKDLLAKLARIDLSIDFDLYCDHADI